jgi:hypothetical protein
MATLAYTWTNTRFFFVALVISVLTGLAMQKFSPALMLVLYMLPCLLVLFYYYPIALISLWLVLFFVSTVVPDMMNEVGPFFLIPMDPAYFFSVILLIIYALIRSKEFIMTIKANPFLIVFLGLILGYILIYIPIHGKSALGEARKAYFLFFFPLLTILAISKFNDLRQLLLMTILLTLALLVTSILRLIMGSPMRSLANAQVALAFLLTTLAILIFRINGKVIINCVIDTTAAVLCLLFVILTQHRSVLISAAFGLLWIYVLSRSKILFISKMIFASITIFTVTGIILIYVPAFERATIVRLSGIINPSSDHTGSWRMKGWSRQWDEISASSQDLLFGQGLGSYYRAFNTLNKHALSIDRQVEPHNAYVQIISHFGLLGLLIYVLLAFWFFWKSFAVRRTLPYGTMRTYVEMSIVNFGAGQAFLVGYGFSLPMLIFLGVGMSTIKLLEDSSRFGEQDEKGKILQAQIE